MIYIEQFEKDIQNLPEFTGQAKESGQLADIIKMCLNFASHNYMKKNCYGKTCDTSDDSIGTKGKGGKIRCPITAKYHLEPIIRGEFEFKDSVAYAAFKDLICPALQLLNLPKFQKFSDYRIRAGDYKKFACQAELPGNKEINGYAPLEEAGESVKSPKGRKNVPLELIYNFVYLKEIRSKISSANFPSELSSEEAMARYADY